MILAITVIIVLEPSQRKDLYVLAMLVVDTLRGGGGYFETHEPNDLSASLLPKN